MNIGDKIKRKENRANIKGTVLGVVDQHEEVLVLIEYKEGGSGWWPLSSLDLDNDNE